MKSTRLAICSTLDSHAGWLDVEALTVSTLGTAVVSSREYSVAEYLVRHTDAFVFEASDDSDVHSKLALSRDNMFSLEFTLALFDELLPADVRKQVAASLEDKLANDANRIYVLDIVLASPLPSTTNVQSTSAMVSSYARVTALMDLIAECQPRAAKLCEHWKTMRSDAMVAQSGFEESTGVLIKFGIFRRLATEAKTKLELDDLKPQLLLAPQLSERCDARILTKLLNLYRNDLPQGAKSKTRIGHIALEREYESEDETASYTARRVPNFEKLRQAESQVEAIAELFALGDDQKANDYLRELVNSQTSNPSNHQHAVKSLCNIARRCGAAGRREIAFQCLSEALKFPSGCDSRLYTQIGVELREIGRFQEAMSCLEKAQSLDDGNGTDRIRNEIIRVYSARGEFEKAIGEYLSLESLSYQPHALSSLGTAYRKIGKRADARKCYLVSLSLEPSHSPATAGLAELAKQRIDFNRAVRIYDLLISRFPAQRLGNIDRSLKIYELARCQLYRLCGQFDRARTQLERMLQNSKLDSDVHLQLAKVFSLMGNQAKARQHFELVQTNQVHDVARALYLAAIQATPHSQGLSPIGSLTSEIASYPREDHGLTRCALAFRAIESEKFEEAASISSAVPSVDKLHHDFAMVLEFHAKRKMDASLDHRAFPSVCRVAKRGYPVLRKTAIDLIDNRFDQALTHERKMCLLIA